MTFCNFWSGSCILKKLFEIKLCSMFIHFLFRYFCDVDIFEIEDSHFKVIKIIDSVSASQCLLTSLSFHCCPYAVNRSLAMACSTEILNNVNIMFFDSKSNDPITYLFLNWLLCPSDQTLMVLISGFFKENSWSIKTIGVLLCFKWSLMITSHLMFSRNHIT